MLAEFETSGVVLKASRAHTAKITQAGWRLTWKTTGRRKFCLPAHKVVIFLIISCGAKLREMSVNSLKAPRPPSEPRSQRKWPAWTGRSSSTPARCSSLGLRLLLRPVGISLNKCVCDTHINFFWNFHSNVNTLTIYFIALNESVGFVLIYRPHPVKLKLDFYPHLNRGF